MPRNTAEIVKRCTKSPHTRIPVYQTQSENIIGVLHAKDLLARTLDAVDLEHGLGDMMTGLEINDCHSGAVFCARDHDT